MKHFTTFYIHALATKSQQLYKTLCQMFYFTRNHGLSSSRAGTR